MKPDGTYTVDELLQICDNQLQSWEREELAEKLAQYIISQMIRDMSIEELEAITGYYCYEDEPEFDIDEELTTEDLIDALEDRLSWQSITKRDKKRIVEIAKTAQTWD